MNTRKHHKETGSGWNGTKVGNRLADMKRLVSAVLLCGAIFTPGAYMKMCELTNRWIRIDLLYSTGSNHSKRLTSPPPVADHRKHSIDAD